MSKGDSNDFKDLLDALGGEIPGPSLEQRARAARQVALAGRDRAEVRSFLQMLGLIPTEQVA